MKSNYIVDIPIFLVIKNDIDEIDEKNKFLLPYVYACINSANLVNRTIVVCDGIMISNYAKEIGFTNTYIYSTHNYREHKHFDFYGPLSYISNKHIDSDWGIVIPCLQPFIDKDIILKIIDNIDDKYDFVTTYNTMVDKTIYYIDDSGKFLYNNPDMQRYHEICPQVKYADGAIYCVKREYAKHCLDSEDPITEFWRGKRKFIENPISTIDLDNKADFIRFKSGEKLTRLLYKTMNKDFDMSFSRAIRVTLVINNKQQAEVSFSANEMRMNYSENSCTFIFDSDEDARNIECSLQMNNVKTSHTDKCIYIKNFAEYDFRVG